MRGKQIVNPYKGKTHPELEDFAIRPANLKILPGVRQLHDGQHYVVGQYPSGKTVLLPYHANGAEAARMLPVPKETVRERKNFGKLFKRKHHVVEVRANNSKWKHVQQIEESEKIKFANETEQQHAEMIAFLKPFSISPNCGKTWIPLEPLNHDWHVCYHTEEE